MGRYAAFLRGINVGGHKRMSMARLKKAFESLGFRDVRTLLASGNVVFEAKSSAPKQLAGRIEAKLKRTFGHKISVVLRKAQELERLAALDPFRRIKVTPMTRLFVTFLDEKPKTGLKMRLKIPYRSPDGSFRILRVTRGEVCSVLQLGPQWSKNLRQMDVLEREFGQRITTRSWSTVVRVVKAGG